MMRAIRADFVLPQHPVKLAMFDQLTVGAEEFPR